jgi:predicted enzyme related to lactoylglutathione lyase
MNLKKLYALVTVESFAHLKEFYCEQFGFSISMEAPGYLHLSGKGNGELAFMVQDKDAPEAFGGKGLTVCLEVADVDAEAARLTKAKVPVVVPLRDNPWGDRSIILRDPVGIHVYVYQCLSTQVM